MRSRRTANERVAEVARRRLELLSAELAEIRPDLDDSPVLGARDGSGEPSPDNSSWDPTPDPDPGKAHGPGRGPGPLQGRHAHRPVGVAASVGGWVQDRLPPSLQGRVQMSGAHLTVVAVLVIGGLALTAWWVSRAEGGQGALPVASAPTALVPVPGVTSGAAGSAAGPPSDAGWSESPASATGSTGSGVAAAGGAASGSATSGTGDIVVDVAGKVRRPGIATLPLGSRVVDALQAAGGPRRGVRLGSLNLARVLADGEQILVGVRAPPGVAASAASAPNAGAAPGGSAVPMVNINTAGQAELEALPDIGPVTARSILDFRAENGTFTSVEELLEVSGIGDAILTP